MKEELTMEKVRNSAMSMLEALIGETYIAPFIIFIREKEDNIFPISPFLTGDKGKDVLESFVCTSLNVLGPIDPVKFLVMVTEAWFYVTPKDEDWTIERLREEGTREECILIVIESPFESFHARVLMERDKDEKIIKFKEEEFPEVPYSEGRFVGFFKKAEALRSGISLKDYANPSGPH